MQLKSAQFLVLLLLADAKAGQAPAHALPRLLAFLSTIINAPYASVLQHHHHQQHNSSSGGGSSSGAGQQRSSHEQQQQQQQQQQRQQQQQSSAAAAAANYADGNGAEVGIQLFEALLRNPTYRARIWAQEMELQGRLPASASSGSGSSASQREQKAQGEQEKIAGSAGGKAHERESIVNGLLNVLRASTLGSGSGSGAGGASGAATPGGSGAGSSGANASGAGAGSGSGSQQQQQQQQQQQAVGPQLQYQAIFCLWLLSFDEEIAEEFNV